MKAFSVRQGRPEEFVDRIRREIERRDFSDIASIGLQDDLLKVTFSWMGKTTLTYRLTPWGDGFSAVLEDEDVSAFHRPFRAGFEERFDQIIATVGATAAAGDGSLDV